MENLEKIGKIRKSWAMTKKGSPESLGVKMEIVF